MAHLDYTTQPKAQVFVKANPADSLQFGVHTSLASSSKHKKMVSAALHLKKESVGRAGRTAYNHGIKAFAQGKAQKVK